MALEPQKVKVVKRDTLSDLDARRILVSKDVRQRLIDERRRLLQRAAEIKRELVTV